MPIYINACASIPNLDGLFNAWLANAAPLSPQPLNLLDLLAHFTPPPEKTGLILATTKGDIDAEIAWIRQPENTSGATPPPILSAPAHDLAAGFNGPVYSVSTACSSGLTALIDAAHTLLDSPAGADHMLVFAYDHSGDFVCDGFTALKALSHTLCKPFDQHRDGLTLGSAAAAALISLTPRQPRAILTGWGLASDAAHMTAPDRHASGLISAIKNALAMARLQPHDIDVLFTHGTGTRYNDAMETVAIDALFSHQRCPLITAVKGLIGHTLGASGLLETALAIKILETQTVPPITGLVTPECPDLPFVIGTPKKIPIRHILKIASGFGGLNAAIILSHPSTLPHP